MPDLDLEAVQRRAGWWQICWQSGDTPPAVNEEAARASAEDVPALVEEVQRLRAENDGLREANGRLVRSAEVRTDHLGAALAEISRLRGESDA